MQGGRDHTDPDGGGQDPGSAIDQKPGAQPRGDRHRTSCAGWRGGGRPCARRTRPRPGPRRASATRRETAPRPRPVPRPVRSPAGRKTASRRARSPGSTKSMLIFAPWRIGVRPLKAWHFQPFRRHRLARGVAGAPARGAVLSAIPFRHGSEHSESAEGGRQNDHAQGEKTPHLAESLNSYHPRGSPRSFSGHDRRVRFQKPDEAVPGNGISPVASPTPVIGRARLQSSTLLSRGEKRARAPR